MVHGPLVCGRSFLTRKCLASLWTYTSSVPPLSQWEPPGNLQTSSITINSSRSLYRVNVLIFTVLTKTFLPRTWVWIYYYFFLLVKVFLSLQMHKIAPVLLFNKMIMFNCWRTTGTHRAKHGPKCRILSHHSYVGGLWTVACDNDAALEHLTAWPR